MKIEEIIQRVQSLYPYPNAKDGFSVIAPNVVGGEKYYIKAGAGWVYQQILAVV